MFPASGAATEGRQAKIRSSSKRTKCASDKSVDLGGIEPPYRACHARAFPLSYRPI